MGNKRRRILYVNKNVYKNNLNDNPYFVDGVEILAYSDAEKAREAGTNFDLFAVHNGVSRRDITFKFATWIRNTKPQAFIVAISQTGLPKKDYLKIMVEIDGKKAIFDDLLKRASTWTEDIDNLVDYLLKQTENARTNPN